MNETETARLPKQPVSRSDPAESKRFRTSFQT